MSATARRLTMMKDKGTNETARKLEHGKEGVTEIMKYALRKGNNTHEKSAGGNLCGKIGILLATFLCVTVLHGCAPYTQAEITRFWNEVAQEYPGCHKMPRIITVDDGSVGGFYYIEGHTVVIDKYASAVVWKHEFRHACGDRLGENFCSPNVDSVLTSIPAMFLNEK
jgi:hypothetical protein